MSSRERFLEATIATIEEHGEVAVRVDEIAQTVGVAKPSIYHYFGSRDGLVAAAQAERYRRALLVGYDDALAALRTCESHQDFQNIIRMWIESFRSPASARRRAVRLDVLGSSVSRPSLRAEIEQANIEARASLEQFLDLARSRRWALTDTEISTSDVAMWLHGLWNGRYLVDLSGDADQIDGWDQVTTHVIELLVLGGARTEG